MTEPARPDAEDVKTCCAALYESDWARLLLGETFHPGGLALTERLGTLLGLGPGDRVLDVACGPGTSALHLAAAFGCQVVGTDLSAANLARARAEAARQGLAGRASFQPGDAERLPFADASFDVIVCECAFCTFPDKARAAGEFARVLRSDGRVGLSDLTRSGPLPPALDGPLAWLACIADARPVDEYVACLTAAGLIIDHMERHDDALTDLVDCIRSKLFGAELLLKLGKLDLPGVDLDRAKALARSAAEAVRAGTLGYAIVVGRRPAG
jgi:ubiquinone/menaquinone biosynthesis C-methylase UbiE